MRACVSCCVSCAVAGAVLACVGALWLAMLLLPPIVLSVAVDVAGGEQRDGTLRAVAAAIWDAA